MRGNVVDGASRGDMELRGYSVKVLIDGFDGLFVKQACLKSGFKDSGFTGGFGFQVVDYGNRLERHRFQDQGSGSLSRQGTRRRRLVGQVSMWSSVFKRRVPSRSGFGVLARTSRLSGFGILARNKISRLSGFRDSKNAPSLDSSKSSMVLGLAVGVTGIRGPFGGLPRPQSSRGQYVDHDKAKESSRGQYVDHDKARNRSRGQYVDHDKSRDQDGSSFGVGVRDASSSPHAFGPSACVGSGQSGSQSIKAIKSGCSDSKARAFAGVTGEPNPLKSHLGRGLKGLLKDL
ncbi:hypothetical protein B0F90DRAFT_1820085 [Multifurca ochricompacta]|uniref:Uncharacterized protein n=1 Tax=Multifurca ochricompacta TaxID=376703 RepID=A0AAD4QLE1_9AGAM|nr:hypothetical protein B0F90DRAFT_1820085 [Multifurca ochricompacta]